MPWGHPSRFAPVLTRQKLSAKGKTKSQKKRKRTSNVESRGDFANVQDECGNRCDEFEDQFAGGDDAAELAAQARLFAIEQKLAEERKLADEREAKKESESLKPRLEMQVQSSSSSTEPNATPKKESFKPRLDMEVQSSSPEPAKKAVAAMLHCLATWSLREARNVGLPLPVVV